MYKRMIILTYALVFFSLFATACSDNNNETYVEPILSQIEVSKLVTENNKTYVSVDGKPFPFLGAQIRLDALLNCDKMTINEVENYFKKAQELGLNCVQIPISWNMVEPKENKYDYSIVNSILQFVNKYNLKMELLWFSTNMVGDSFSYLIPQYVLQEYNKRLSRNDEGNFWNYYGYQYTMILDDEWILERETKAITALFNHIRYWDSQNGDKHPVISAQIHNEPDALMRWRIDQKDLKYRDGTPLSKEKAWTMITNALNTVGKAVKNSSYRVVTRVNLIYGDGINPFPEATNARPKDVFDLQGIDFIGVDAYKDNVKHLKNEVMAYASIAGNYALVAENKGSYANSPSLILTSFALGGGYDIYDLATSNFFINNTTEPDQIDHGIYTWDLQEKDFTPPTRSLIKGLAAAYIDVAKVKPENFAAFNINDNQPKDKLEQLICTTGAQITFQTKEKKYNSYLKSVNGYASSLKACTHLYDDGVKIFITLAKLKTAIKGNPQGIVASMSMNNLYIETATELVSVFNLLNDAVANGGTENMLTGADRSKTLWALNDKLSAFQKKLNKLYLSIRYYTMSDVWNNVTAGMIDRNNGEIATQALGRWRRAAKVSTP